MMRCKTFVPATLTALLGASVLLSGCDNASQQAAQPAPAPDAVAAADTTTDSTPKPDLNPVGRTDERTTPSLANSLSNTASSRDTISPKGDLGSTSQPSKRPAPTPAVDPETYMVKAIPASLDLGKIPTGEVGKGMVTLVNQGNESVHLNQCKTSCGCTTANCPRGQQIAPGEEVEIEVTLKGGTSARKLNKKVTFIFNDDERLLYDVSGEAVQYVSVDPQYIIPERVEDGRIVVKSGDGQAFKINSMSPPILTEEDFAVDELEEHVLYLDWARWEELGSQRKVTFFINHPLAEQATATIRPLRPSRTSPRDNPTTVGAAEKDAGDGSLPFVAIDRAIKEGRNDVILDRLEAGELELTRTDRSGASLLHLTAKYGNLELLEELVQRDADVDATDRAGRTALMVAAQSKHPDAVEALLEAGATVDTKDLVGSALSWGAGFGDPESVQLLIDAGADVEVAGQPTGFTPLIWAAGFGDAQSVRAIIDAGADLEKVDMTHSATALMHAARTGSPEKIQILVEAGADLEARDATGKTPLLIAADASGATVEMIQALVDAGADLNATDNREQTVLDLAKKRTDPRGQEVLALIESLMGGGE